MGFAVCLTLAMASCSRAKATPAPPPFDGRAFIVAAMQLTRSDVDIATLARRKGSLPETRALAADVAREQQQMLDALAPLARKRSVPPPAVPDVQLALQQNLDSVIDLYDQAYVLGTMQNFDVLRAALDRAAVSNDRELQQFAQRWIPVVASRRAAAATLLNGRLGGSPFHVAP